jgi:FMN-dependent NADH-azoreductase
MTHPQTLGTPAYPGPRHSTLLYLEASPRREDSRSTRAAEAFLAEIRAGDPAVRVDHLDLWTADLPPFRGPILSAKYARLAGLPHGPEEAAAWETIEALVARLTAADRVVISTPIWNFGIPYRLKHWIDLVTQPGLTFRFDPESGYTPLLPGKPTLVVLASAGDYATGSSYGRPDLATPYLRAALGFIGLADPIVVQVAPTIGPNAAEAERLAGLRLRALAPDFVGTAA